MFLGRWEIDNLLTFTVNTHTPSTGAGTDADAVPSYRVYEDETGTAILTGNMAKLDDANTVGFYSEQITLSAANGFEVGKSYTVYVAAVVGGVTGTLSHSFQVEAALATAASISSLNNLSAAQVNAQALAALNTYDPPTKAEMDAGFAGISATVFPAGAIEFTYTVTNSVTGNPIEGVEIWISTDNPATNIVWKGETDAFGIAMDVLGNKPMLDSGVYFFWRQLAGYLFNNPDQESVS